MLFSHIILKTSIHMPLFYILLFCLLQFHCTFRILVCHSCNSIYIYIYVYIHKTKKIIYLQVCFLLLSVFYPHNGGTLDRKCDFFFVVWCCTYSTTSAGFFTLAIWTNKCNYSMFPNYYLRW